MYATQNPLMILLPYTFPKARTMPMINPAVIDIKVRMSVFPNPVRRFGIESRKN
jgi:hypothetical protein